MYQCLVLAKTTGRRAVPADDLDSLVRRLTGDPAALPGETGMVPVVYRANMRDPSALFQARMFQILDKDILYVANAPLSEVQKLFALINTLASPAYAARELTR